jgi:queuine tRNA-ribosyltransferase
MGVGYPLDLVVCSALGVDMYDCVYPTRTARFGVALVDCEAPGTLRLKGTEFARDLRVVDPECKCECCAGGYSRSKLSAMFKAGDPVAAQLLTAHNIAYMLRLVRRMREAVLEDR